VQRQSESEGKSKDKYRSGSFVYRNGSFVALLLEDDNKKSILKRFQGGGRIGNG
jgi:hypothetical protein